MWLHCVRLVLEIWNTNVNYKKRNLFLADDLLDDTSSESSSHSGTYSNLNYFSGDEIHNESNINPATSDKHSNVNTKTRKFTRFCPEERNQNAGQCNAFVPSRASKDNRVVMDSLRLNRNRSLVDIRSQLLHRSLVEEVYKRRLFNTIGAVENIGFQSPYEVAKQVGASKNVKGTHQGHPSRRV